MKRPSSPRRDYLMCCAQRQLLPVPVLTSAFKVTGREQPRAHASQSCRPEATVGDRKNLAPGDVARDASMGDGVLCRDRDGKDRTTEGDVAGNNGHEEVTAPAVLNGGILLRHYYIGAARAKCLESAVTSAPVALTQVSGSMDKDE